MSGRMTSFTLAPLLSRKGIIRNVAARISGLDYPNLWLCCVHAKPSVASTNSLTVMIVLIPIFGDIALFGENGPL